MSISLDEILGLVGRLDDSEGDDTSRERFRHFLQSNVKEVGQVRDYVEHCLRQSGDQQNKALQDLVNYLGQFLGFEVTFGRYRGTPGQIGFDGYWKSPTNFHIVIEVKTSEAYSIKAATLDGYINQLISEKEIPARDSAMGLYVVGKPDPEVRHIENAIVAEKRTRELRIISADSLISLAEMMSEYDVTHEDVLSILRPSGPTIDSVVDLIGRLIAQDPTEPPSGEPPVVVEPPAGSDTAFWLTPVKGDQEKTAEEVIETLVGKERIYAVGERTPGRKHLRAGDWISFYSTAKGVVAHARVASSPERKPHRAVRHPQKYPWTFHLDSVLLYLDKPVVIDAATRTRLDAFQGRDLDKSWAWFVQATRKITEHDFRILSLNQASS